MRTNGIGTTINNGVISRFDWHCDDDGNLTKEFEHGCNTIIFYIRKDPTLRNGNLEVMDPDLRCIDVTPLKNTIKMVAMSGTLEHCPQSIIGIGIRDCVVLQFKNLEPHKAIDYEQFMMRVKKFE